MISKPINNLLKKKLGELHKVAFDKAICDFDSFNKKLSEIHNHFDKYSFVFGEEKRIKKLVKGHTHPFYIENHSTQEWLIDQFSGRSFLLNIDESREFIDAIYLGTYYYKVADILWDLEKQIPEYTYDDFLNKKVCRYWDKFEKSHNIGESDYSKIKIWQAYNFVSVVEYEFVILVRKIQKYCCNISDPLKFISEEKEKIETISSLSDDYQALFKKLSELHIFQDSFLPFEKDLLLKHFQNFKKDKMAWADINPLFLNPLLKKIEEKTSNAFFSEVTIFHVLNKISEWFDFIVGGQSIQLPIKLTNWNQLFANLIKEAQKEVEETCSPINDYAYNKDLDKEEVRSYLIKKFNIYREKFNDFDDKYWFNMVDEERHDTLRSAHRLNSFFSNKPQEQNDSLKKAILIYEVSWEIARIYNDIFETRQIRSNARRGSHMSVMSLLNQMVIDKELHSTLRTIMKQFFDDFHSTTLPLEMHFQNQQEAMSKLFKTALGKLEYHLNDAEPTNKILFLQSRIKELRHRELQHRQIQHELDEEIEDEFSFVNLFREFLEIEADYVNNVKDIESATLLQHTPNNQKLLTHNSTKTFEEVFPEYKGTFVVTLLEDLSITVNGVSQLTPKRVGAIRGIVDALLQHNIAPQLNVRTLCILIAEKTGISLPSGKIDVSRTSHTFLKKANQYILANYKFMNKV